MGGSPQRSVQPTQLLTRLPHLLGTLFLTGSLVGLVAGFFPVERALTATGNASVDSSITNASVGTPVNYQNAIGDTWYNTWADDGNLYTTSDDTAGFTGACLTSNLAVNELSGGDPTSLQAPFVNCMTSYGYGGDKQNYADGRTWKTGGIISVAGTLYLVVSRQVDGSGGYPNGYQPVEDASIVKSSDHGRTWSNSFGTSDDPTGAQPPYDASTGHVKAMFPGSSFVTPFFINYGQDDNIASTADGGDQYVYAISNDGFAYDGSRMVLGRVLRSQIGDLDASQWQFYSGAVGGNGLDSANWSNAVNAATPVLSAAHQLSQSGIQYVPVLHRYLLTSFYYPFDSGWPTNGDTAHTTWSFYQAPAPWGPWTPFLTHDTSPDGLYDPALVSKFQRIDGLSETLFSSGDFVNYNHPGDNLYRLHVYPLALHSGAVQITDDSSSSITYQGSWTSGSLVDYFENGTVHDSQTPGDTASFTFTGSFIAWVGSTNHNHGEASVSIDGGAATVVDTYSPGWDKQAMLFERTGLANGSHTITITVTDHKNTASSGYYQDIDGFEFGAALPPVIGLDDTASSLMYSSGWLASSNSAYFKGTLHASNVPGSAVSYPFTGPTIAWVGSTNHNHGVALVSIDGGVPTAVDTYSPQWETQAVLFERTGLSDGSHTITITVGATKDAAASDYYQDIDAFAEGLVPPPVTMADDTASSLMYSSGWLASSNPAYVGGTLHYSNVPGSSVTYTFTGTSIAWIGSTNHNHGEATVSIDNGTPITVDTYSPQWAPQTILFERTGLSPYILHTITITVGATKDAAASNYDQDIDAFESGFVPPSVTGIDDVPSSLLTYSKGGWLAGLSPFYYDGTLHASNVPGSSVTYTFTGTSIAWIGSTNTNHGEATVSIDNGTPITVDTYSSQWGLQAVLFERTGLSNGSHTITITVTGSKNAASSDYYQDIDAFESGI